jgi:hypothetical protein
MAPYRCLINQFHEAEFSLYCALQYLLQNIHCGRLFIEETLKPSSLSPCMRPRTWLHLALGKVKPFFGVQLQYRLRTEVLPPRHRFRRQL